MGDDRFCGKCGTPHSTSAVATSSAAGEPGIPDVPTQIAEVDVGSIAQASARDAAIEGSKGRTRRGVGVPFMPGANEPTHRIRPRKRRLGCWVVGLGAAIAGFALVGGYLFRDELAPFVGRAGLPNVAARMENLRPQQVVVRLPEELERDGIRANIRLTYDVPRPPAGFVRVGAAHSITLPGGRKSGGVVRISLPEPRAVEDPSRAFFLGRHDGHRWHVYSASIERGFAVAEVPGFSTYVIFVLIRRSRPNPGEGPTLGVLPPELWGIRIRGDRAWAELQLDDCRTAFAPEGGWTRGVRVERLKIYVSRPDRTLPASDPRSRRPSPSRMTPYAYPVAPGGEPQVVTLPALAVGGTQSVPLDLDLTRPLAADANDTVASGFPWMMSVAPIFSDGSEGRQSRSIFVYTGVAEAHVMLRRGLAARMGAQSREAFLAATEARPYYVWLGSSMWLREGYLPATGMRNRTQLAARWQSGHGMIAMQPENEWARVVTHEWGHYATHNMWGDVVFARTPSGQHSGWKEAASRALAFSEDVATWLGQFGTGAGLPPTAGAMGGRITDYGQRPDAYDDLAQRWPQNRAMDVVRVESVGASILSRLSAPELLGFERVYSAVQSRTPANLVDLYTAVTDGLDLPLVARVQAVYLDERVVWRVRGRVVGRETPDAEPAPIEGALVRVRATDDSDLGTETATTDAQGSFELDVPVGSVSFRVTKDGWRPSGPFTHLATFSQPTNGPAQVREEPLLMERGQAPSVAITAPTANARLTERLITVSGTVEGTQDGTPTGRPIDRARLFVGADQYELTVVRGRFDQRIVVGRGALELRVLATNEAGDGEARVAVQSDVVATYVRVVLTWAGTGTDVDLWVTDPEGVETGFSRMRPAPGRALDLDDRDGLGPETYTATRLLPGTYRVRVNFFRGRSSDEAERRAERESFIVRWVTMEGTPTERRGEATGTLTGADGNAGRAESNHSFTFELAAPPATP